MASIPFPRWTLVPATWLGVALAWMTWFVGGFLLAILLHTHLAWGPVSSDGRKGSLFAPVTLPSGEMKLVSFLELEQGRFDLASWHPPKGFSTSASTFPEQADAFFRNHGAPFGRTGRIELMGPATAEEGSRYKLAVFFKDGSIVRWRYVVQGRRIQHLWWYIMSETSGGLFPLMFITLIVWVSGLPVALMASRRLRKMRILAATPTR